MRRLNQGNRVDFVNTSLCLIPMVLLILQLSSCSRTVQVGIVAGLTGVQSELGVAGRDGALLRFEQESTKSGINRFTVLIEDDKNDPQLIQEISQRFNDSGVGVAIGPFTSTTALAAAQSPGKVLFVSPTASAGRLSGQDDMLIRLMGSVEATAMKLAHYARTKLGVMSVAAVWDIRNRIYAEDYLTAFASGWESGARWQEISTTYEYKSNPLISHAFNSNTEDSLVLASEFLEHSQADAVLLIANGSNASSIIRMLRRDGYNGVIIVSGWAVTSDLRTWGTESLEGVVFSQQYDPDLDSPRFKAFRQEYFNRFGLEPSFAAIFGYEAADLVIRALTNGSPHDADSIKRSILSLTPFESLQGRLQLDDFGDPLREPFTYQFQSGIPVRIQ